MSMNNALVTDEHHDLSPSSGLTIAGGIIPGQSSKTLVAGKKIAGNIFNNPDTYLDVPSYRPSRASLDSAFSDVSELSIHSNELHTAHSRPLLQRSTSSYQEPDSSTLTRRVRFLAIFHRFWIANYGALLVVLAQFFGSLMNLATRLLETPGPHGEPMHPFQILFARQSITAALCTTFALKTGSIPDFPLGPRGIRWLLVIRGLCGFFGVFGLYFSLLYLPLAEATVLTFLAPILTCYLCSFTMKGETFSKQQQLAGFVSLVGVVFIARPAAIFAAIVQSGSESTSTHKPEINGRFMNSGNSTSTPSTTFPGPTPSQHLTAIGISMIGVLGATGAMSSIRAMGTRAHPFLSINYFSVWCSIVSLFFLIVIPSVKFRLPGNLMEWALLASLGLCGFVMQFLLTAGLSYGGPSTAPTKETNDVENVVSSSRARRDEEKAETTKSLKKGSGTRATSMVYTQMLFALAGDKFVFSVTPGVMSWIGSGLILTGAIWVAAAKDKEKNVDRNNNDNTVMNRGEPISAVDVAFTGSSGFRQKQYDSEDIRTGEGIGLMTDDLNYGEDLVGNELEMNNLVKRETSNHDGPDVLS